MIKLRQKSSRQNVLVEKSPGQKGCGLTRP